MSETITKTDVLAQVAAARREWESVLAGLTPQQMTTPGVVGEWSVKDIVTHVRAWEGYAANQLGAAARGETPDRRLGFAPQAIPAELLQADDDPVNAWIYEQHRHRPVEDILAEERQAYQDLLAAVEELPEDALLQPRYFTWAGDAPLLNRLTNNTVHHYPEHSASIRDWLESQA